MTGSVVPAAAPGAAGDMVLLGCPPQPAFLIEEATDPAGRAAYYALRRQVFVGEQGLFAGHDLDWHDEDPRGVVLVARDGAGTVIGGVRLGPAVEGPDVGWWYGGRLVVARRHGAGHGVGAALVRAACARAESSGALRFEATVQAGNERFFTRLGWQSVRDTVVAGIPHVLMRWPIGRISAHAASTKQALGALLGELLPSDRYLGDDGVPVPGSDLIAACDAIVPALVERDPEWAGWCGVLVNVNDLAAMGAEPIGLLDAEAGRDRAAVGQVLSGLRAASEAYGVPVLGGHTQFGVPAALSVTAFGRTTRPVSASGGRPGHAVSVIADLGGSWRRGYTGCQWDSTTHRSSADLRAMAGSVAANHPAAAKDVSMAGLVGTLGMLAEASGCGAILDVAVVPRPQPATVGDWLTCFPGFAMLTTDEPGRPIAARGPVTVASCGELTAGHGVRLRWPDGELTSAITDGVTGLGRAPQTWRRR